VATTSIYYGDDHKGTNGRYSTGFSPTRDACSSTNEALLQVSGITNDSRVMCKLKCSIKPVVGGNVAKVVSATSSEDF